MEGFNVRFLTNESDGTSGHKDGPQTRFAGTGPVVRAERPIAGPPILTEHPTNTVEVSTGDLVDGFATTPRKTLFAGPVADDAVAEMMEESADGSGSTDWQNNSIGPFRMNIDLRPRLHEISCPALFIQGADDIGIPLKRTVDAAGAVPGSRLEVLPGVGHWANRQQPDLVNQLISGFLQSA